MKKIVSVLCAALALAACGQDDANTIKIGAVLPMTGSNASVGASIRAGIETALADKTNTKYKYKIVIEDGQGAPAKSVSAAQKLISADSAKVLISATIPVGRALVPIAESANVLNLSATLESENAEPLGKNGFIQGPSFESFHAKTLSALKKNNVKSIAIIASNVGVSCTGSQVLGKKINAAGIKATVECFNPGERDFKFIADKYKNVDAYYVSAFPPESDMALRQLYSMGVERNRIYGQGLDLSGDTEVFQGVNHIMATLGTPEFVERINSEYNLKTLNLTSAAYDLISLTVDAFETVGPDNMDAVYDYIRQHATRDCMSGTCKLLPNGFIVNEAEWRTYKDGKPVVIER